MNIKSLLLGSAAALVAVTGARAADAVVVAEPEPVEYVRVCDVYGAGFYYIPGTETCLKVGGYIRYDIGVGALGHQDVDDRNSEDDDNDLNDTFYKKARFAIRFDARTETELGTLRGYGAIKFDRTTSDVGGVVYTSTSQDLDHAYIELGGFRIGKTNSLFDTFTGSAGDVINDGIVPYAPGGTHQISYTFTGGNGFTAMVGLEEGNSGDVYVDADGDEHKALFTLDSYIPHVLAGVGYTAGWGGVSFVGAYDSVWEEFAVKARVDVKATETISAFLMAGYKSSEDTDVLDADGNLVSFAGPNNYGPWGGDWAIWGGLSAKVAPKATVNVQLSYDDYENFGAVANVAYELVPGFVITPEVVYQDAGHFPNEVDDADGDDSGEWGGFLRFQRNF